jgi:hypothetical protein
MSDGRVQAGNLAGCAGVQNTTSGSQTSLGLPKRIANIALDILGSAQSRQVVPVLHGNMANRHVFVVRRAEDNASLVQDDSRDF